MEEPVVGMTRTESWPELVRLIDSDSSLTEEVGFFPGEGGPLYGVHHRTRSDAGFGVVIAPPFLMEFQRNYRRDVLLARALAVIGVPSFRFSYRGQGHSGGKTSELGFDAAVADTVAAIGRMRSRSGVERIVLVGTRLGGIVAAEAAGRSNIRHLAIADPVVTGAAWLRELSRAERVQAMQDNEAPSMSLADQLAADGEAEVLGSSIFPALYEETAEKALVDATPDAMQRVLLVQFGSPEKIAKRLQVAADTLTERGIDVRLTAVAEEEGWWASRRADHFQSETTRVLTRELIPVFAYWIGESHD